MVAAALSHLSTFPSLTLPAPAKLNLCLHITGQRADGYHDLQTVFQLLDYGDTLHFSPRNDGSVRLSPNIKGIPPEDNLVWRAAEKLKIYSSLHSDSPRAFSGIDIRVEKRIPMGGGLGGGSSNAATTLIALNHLWRCGLNNEQLQEVGLGLGADVPVFVLGHSAWAEGVGEQLSPLELPSAWFLVLTPACHVTTAEVFTHKDLTRDTPPITVAAFLEQGGKNDCQPLVRALHPEVDKALIWLDNFSCHATMSGTGASVFAAFDSEAEAREILNQAPKNLTGFVARGVNRSPVHGVIADREKSDFQNR